MKLSIPDMSCAHCRSAIEEAVTALGGQAQVDLDSREAEITGISSPAPVIAALEAIGFPAQDITG